MNHESPVKLYPHQVDHVEIIWNALMKNAEFSYLDTSLTGLGKTHISLEIAWRLQKTYGLRVGIIAPNDQSINNDDGWLYWANKYGIIVEKATTYAKLRGRKGSISDNWLMRDPDDKKGYHATTHFKNVTKAGIFLIFDEVHMATRNSSTHYACAALVRECLRNNARCRVGLISLTPGDKLDHYPQLMRMFGLIIQHKLVYNLPFTRDYEWVEWGLGDMVRSCVRRGVPEPQVITEITQYPMSMAASKKYIQNLYSKYIKDRVCFSMPLPKKEHKVEMFNTFLECVKEDVKPLNDSISMLCKGVAWNGNDVGDKKEWSIGMITRALQEIEKNKLKTIARYVVETSIAQPNKKFIINIGARGSENLFDFRNLIIKNNGCISPDTLKTIELIRRFRKTPLSLISKDVLYNVLLPYVGKMPPHIMYGKTKNKNRVNILRKFQSPNLNSWCLIISPGVGGQSISLHDKHGGYPREVIIVPDHFHTRITQSTGRVERVGFKSDVRVNLVYIKEANMETSILDCMSRKSKTAKDMLAKEQVMKFPGDFPVWVEKDPNGVVANEIRRKLR